jgi:hypothetical protein
MAKRSDATDTTANAETIWVSSSEARLTLGGMTKQKWWRVCREYSIKTQLVDGMVKYDATRVDEVRERLGIATGETHDDPRDVALENFLEENRMLRGYVKELHESERAIVNILREENESLRKLRAVEQKAFLDSMLAMQEAMDHTAERELERKAVEFKQVKMTEGIEMLRDKIIPGLLGQTKIASFVRSLSLEHVAALRTITSPDQFAAIQTMLNPMQIQELEKYDRATATDAAPLSPPGSISQAE